MSIQVNQKDLQKQFDFLTPVTKSRSPLPILSNTAMVFTEDTSEIFATNLEVYIKTKVNLLEVTSPIKTTANAEKISDIIKNLRSDQPVQIEEAGNQRIVITQGPAKFTVNTLSLDDFPVFPGTPENAIQISVATSDLAKALESVVFAASDSDSRFNLSSVYISPEEDSLRLVTTDGHRLAVHVVACSLQLNEEAKGIMLPKSSAMHLLKWLSRVKEEQVTLQLHPKAITLETAEFYVSMRLLDGDYPDYRKVIPNSLSTPFTVKRSEIIDAVKRVGLMTSDRNRGIQMLFDGKSDALVISCNNPDLGEAVDQISIGRDRVEPFEIIMNRDYVMDAVSVISADTIYVYVSITPGLPVMFKADADAVNFNIVMPMRK